MLARRLVAHVGQLAGGGMRLGWAVGERLLHENAEWVIAIGAERSAPPVAAAFIERQGCGLIG